MDLTLAVLAAALALAGFQFGVTRVFRGWLDYSRWPGWIARPSPRIVLYMLSDATAPLIPLAGAGTGLLLVLRALPPRRPWRRVWRQPGMAACLSALVALLWVGLSAGLILGIVLAFPAWRFDGLSFAQELHRRPRLPAGRPGRGLDLVPAPARPPMDPPGRLDRPGRPPRGNPLDHHRPGLDAPQL